MRADNSHHLVTAARDRAAATHRRAVAALRRMDTASTAITFDAVAREANVSRSWLYNQSELRVEIERLRARQQPASRTRPVPDRQHASDNSLLQRLHAATERLNNLEIENRELRDALARALGERRAAQTHGLNADTPTKKSP